MKSRGCGTAQPCLGHNCTAAAAHPPPPSFHLQVHSLTQNTTHRKIRIGPEHQAVLPPFPSAKK